MAPRSMSEMLGRALPAPSSSKLVEIEETISDLDRIKSLPRRAPLCTERDPKTRRYVAPETQALVEVVTAKYARPERLSCACRPRRVVRGDGDQVFVERLLPDLMVPEAPQAFRLGDFVRDQVNGEVAKQVGNLRLGESVELQAADKGMGHPCVVQLNAVQAWTLWEAEKFGVLGWLGVGSGKTLVSLIVHQAFSDCRLAVTLIEPSQRKHYESHYLRLREHFKVSSVVFDHVPGYTVPGTPPLHIIPYSHLSQTHSTDLLDRLNPDVIIADEAHRIAGESARTRRILRYVRKRIAEREEMIRQGQPVRRRAVYFLPWSGTLEDKSIRDTQHLAAFALGTGSPVPIDPAEADKWSQVIDPVKIPDRSSSTARALQRTFGGGEAPLDTSVAALLLSKPEESIRKGYKERRLWTPGVISASAASIGAAIYFKERKAPPIPKVVQDALAGVRQDALRPDGDLIVEQSMQVEVCKQIISGFHYFWKFLNNKCTCGPMKLIPCDGCLLIADWYARRKDYGRALRALLLRGLNHLDSPKLCQHAAERSYEKGDTSSERIYCANCNVDWPCQMKTHLPAWGIASWGPWAEIKDKVPHEQCVKWLSDYLAKDAAEWATEHRGIVWVISIALGHKIAELSGLPYHGGGPESEDLIRAETGKRSIICSLAAHGSGRDGLQEKFSEQLFAEMPAGNKKMEQALGRIHRFGQMADSVVTEAYLHAHELRESLRKVIARAEFNEQMVGIRSKILMCDFDLQSMEL